MEVRMYIHGRYEGTKWNVLPIKPMPINQSMGVYAGAKNPMALKLQALCGK
jgi:hypothetical protein